MACFKMTKMTIIALDYWALLFLSRENLDVLKQYTYKKETGTEETAKTYTSAHKVNLNAELC